MDGPRSPARVHPAQLNVFIYGFAVQAGLGVLLWIIAHLGRTHLAKAPLILAGGMMWNLGVLLGILGILLGDNTGYEWLEMPRYASLMIFFGYLAIGVGALVTFHQRRERQLEHQVRRPGRGRRTGRTRRSRPAGSGAFVSSRA